MSDTFDIPRVKLASDLASPSPDEIPRRAEEAKAAPAANGKTGGV